MIYSDNDVNFLLGILCIDTEKCLDTKYPLDKEDFECELFHKIVYSVIYNLATKGVKRVDSMMITEFLINYPPQKATYDDNNGSDYIDTIIKLSCDKVENIQYYWESVRKHSLLREYILNGTDVSEIWDVDKSDVANEEELNKWTIDKICNHFDIKQSKIRKVFLSYRKTEEMIAGDGFDNLLDRLEETPMIGAGLASPMLNELYRGWCKGHLLLRGAPSGFGKTLYGIKDHLNVSSLYLWSDEKQDFILNPYYQGMGAYFHSEQKMEEEIQTRVASVLSNIPYNIVLNGSYNTEQKKRLSKAGEILYESKFKLINYPDFTSTGMRERIRDLSLEGYEYITVDYIWNNHHIITDIKKATGLSVNEAGALLHYGNSLKMDAEEFNVGIATMIQLNDTYKTATIIDEGCLYGSKAIKTKLDNGSIMTIPTKKDLAQLESMIIAWNKKYNPATKNEVGNILYPNIVSNCFKTRYGSHGQNVRVWHFGDNGTGELIDMFATTWDNKMLTDKYGKPYDLPRLYIENKTI